MEHVLPRSRGGTNNPRNVIWAGRSCNAAKGNMLIGEFLALLEATSDPRAEYVEAFVRAMHVLEAAE